MFRHTWSILSHLSQSVSQCCVGKNLECPIGMTPHYLTGKTPQFPIATILQYRVGKTPHCPIGYAPHISIRKNP